MDGNKMNVSLTPTLARQTPRTEFGEVMKNTLENATKAVGTVSGALMGSLPGGGIISAAVSSVTGLANSGPTASAGMAASGITNVPSAGYPGGVGVTQQVSTGSGMPSNVSDMVQQMRAEADRSMMMQMKMQAESREYNAVSNVLKVRHDSAKSAINNIR